MSDADSPAPTPGAATSGARTASLCARFSDHHQDMAQTENVGAEPAAEEKTEGGDEGNYDSDILSDIPDEELDELEEQRPVEIDEDAVKALKASKRKVGDGEIRKKAKPRLKKRARADEDDLEFHVNEGEPGDRRRYKSRNVGVGHRDRSPEKRKDLEENLTPEERRRRALDRAIDAAIKNPVKRRRKKDEIDLEDEIDEQIASLKVRMENACVADNEARDNGRPATAKLGLLPEVTALLNRTSIQDAVLDPETNFLQAVKYFLEPLNDGSLPAYSIQRDLFTALTKLPITKDVLLSSGIGKVVIFYTKTRQAETVVKRMAERLVGEWSRPILKRTDDYKKRQIETREYNPVAAKEGAPSALKPLLSTRLSRNEEERRRQLAPEKNSKRLQPPSGLLPSYKIAPVSTFDGSQAPDHRPIGAAGSEAFRKITQKGKGR